MKKRMIGVCLSAILLATLCACQGVPTEPQETSAEQIGTTAPVTQAWHETEAQTQEPYVKQTFDTDEVYEHVFENHSKKLTSEEYQALEINSENHEAVVIFVYGCTTPIDAETAERQDIYLVRNVTSDMNANPDRKTTKYELFIANAGQPSGIGANVLVCYDYFEAYIDVLLANLTFGLCDEIPDYQDDPMNLGYIRERSSDVKYWVCANGRVYYEQDGACYESEQQVDAAYIVMMQVIEYGQSLHKRRLLFNQPMDIEGELREYVEGSFVVDENNIGYWQIGNQWTFYYLDLPVHAENFILVYAEKTYVCDDLSLLTPVQPEE